MTADQIIRLIQHIGLIDTDVRKSEYVEVVAAIRQLAAERDALRSALEAVLARIEDSQSRGFSLGKDWYEVHDQAKSALAAAYGEK